MKVARYPMVCRATFRCEVVYSGDGSSFQATTREFQELGHASYMRSQVLTQVE
jgi:hypothetical protein